MNCDQAFDLMTDPALDDSAELHEHLDGCSRCRQMYETLSPALGLFRTERAHVATVLDEHVTETASSVDVAQRVAVSLADAPDLPITEGRWRRMAAYAAVGVVSFSLTLGLLTALTAPSVPSPFQSGECTWLNPDAADQTQDAQAVVRSCMSCHVSMPTATADSREAKYVSDYQADDVFWQRYLDLDES